MLLYTLLSIPLVLAVTPEALKPKAQYVDCRTQVPQAIMDTNSTLPSTLPPTLKCGYVTVPMNYSRPLSPRNSVNITFSINAINSTRGVLLYNPGGPGEEAQGYTWGIAGVSNGDGDYVAGLGGFDFLGIDNRGCGYSNPIICDEPNFSIPLQTINSSHEYDIFRNNIRNFSVSCAEKMQPQGFFDHLGSDVIAQDFESVRIALGYEKLNYFGYSYGTVYGQEYLARFPKSAGIFVLDAIATFQQTNVDLLVGQGEAFDRTIERADAYCQANKTACANISIPDTYRSVSKLADLPGVSYIKFLSSRPTFAAFSQALALAASGNTSLFDYPHLQSFFAKVALIATAPTFCSDFRIDDPSWEAYRTTMAKVHSDDRFGVDFAPEYTFLPLCAFWPHPKSHLSYPNITNPVLLVTSDFDNNTPTTNSDIVKAHMLNATLIARHGDDHGSIYVKGPVRDAMLAYIYNGIVPKPMNSSIYSVYGPGERRTSIVNPYLAPVGVVAGDIEAGDISPAS